jgi:isoquinoline 1-oxidoreductase subunit beta
VTSVRPRRRGLLQAGGAALAVAFLPGCSLPVIPKRPKPGLENASGWVRFEQGRYTLFIPRVEMGQNILTALKQIACQELGVDWALVEARLPSTRDIARVRATVGSESVKDFAVPLAQACATLRDAVASGLTHRQMKAIERPVTALRAFQAGGSHVGRAVALEQGAAIVRGQPLYAADVRRPGMVYGRVLRAGASPELTSAPVALNEAGARASAGFVALVRDPLLTVDGSAGIGIVARTPGALDRIEQALAVQWRVSSGFDQPSIDDAVDIDRRLAASSHRAHRVHADRLSEEGPWDVDLRIDIPLAAHAPIEPRAAVAEIDGQGGLQLWVGTQDLFYQRDVMAKRLNLAEDRIVVHGQRVGGAFGGKTICTVELEAAVLARAAAAPVKVQWTRAQEFQQGFHRPPSSHRIRARVRDGRLEDWWHSFSSSHILFTSAVVPPWLQRLTNLIGDDGVARGSALPYAAAAHRTEFDLVRLPAYTGPWRGLGAGPNVFAIESAIDECARSAGADPVRFRLDHLTDPRLIGVLKAAAQAADWGATRPARTVKRCGSGVACGIYKAMSYAAVVAEVEVDAATGIVKVTRLWCAHDCGLVINPDQVRAQCEGNLVWGLGMVLMERLPVGDSQVGAATFADSPIPRLGDVPPMDVVLVDGGHPPSGAGETAIVAAGAAIANAVRDATGWRAQRLPISPDLLAAHLRRAA